MEMDPQLMSTQVAPKEALVPSAESLIKRYMEHIAQLALKTKDAIERRIQGAREFLKNIPPEHWKDRDTGEKMIRLPKGEGVNSFITFLLLYGYLRPGYAFLFFCRFSNLIGESLYSPYEPETRRFLACCTELGFTPGYSAAITKTVLRLLIQSGKSLGELTLCDLTELKHAITDCKKPKRYHVWLFSIQNVLYHLGILDHPATNPRRFSGDWGRACAGISQESMRETVIAFLERLTATLSLSTVKNYKGHLKVFTKYLEQYPEVKQFAQLQRDRHIDPWLSWNSKRLSLYTGKPKLIALSYRIASVVKIKSFFDYLAEWDWDACPSKRLLFNSDIPKREISVPRFISPEKETLLMAAIHELPEPLVRHGLLVLRNTGMRIGELLSLEMDCVHHIPGVGCWVKIPPGKLKTERMVPIDEESLSYFDQLIKCRGVQKPLPDPKSGILRDYLMVRHGKRISTEYLRDALFKATQMAGLTDESGAPSRIKPHQLRHTYATSLVNAGLSLPALMSLLGHVSMEMSLRYGRMFHHTIREQYDRALEQIKIKYAALALKEPVTPFQATRISVTQSDWMVENYYKTRLVHGFCLRTPEQGACPHANICEKCFAFYPFHEFLTAIYQQLQDIQSLIKDARIRGWNMEANRHLELVAKLDELLKNNGFDPPTKKRGRPKNDNDN